MSTETPVSAVPEPEKSADAPVAAAPEATSAGAPAHAFTEKISGGSETDATETSTDARTTTTSATSAPDARPTVPASVDVLIVGAGPVGMAAAISLRVAGVDNVAIVDARSGGTTLSRAVVIHARTMEELETLGCTDPIIDRAIKAKHMYISARDTNLAKVNFGGLTRVTKYPYATLISQSETEEVLQKRLEDLGLNVLRPYSVSDIKESANGIQVTFNDGSVTTTRYLIGADGSRSTVRRLARIPFRDPKTGAELAAYSGNTTVEPVKKGKKKKTTGFPLIIADAYMTIPSDAHHVSLKDMSVFLGDLGFLLLVPLPPAPDDPEKRTIYRLSCAPEPNVPEKTINKSWLQSMVDSTIGFTKTGGCKVESVIWSSSFVAQSATADTFTKAFGRGTIVLIGDAAHIHSPAGGQGMNLGLRDAAQLGRIISQLLKESKPATPGVVDSRLVAFGKRRRDLATEVIKMTKVITWATGLKAPASRKTRNAVWWLVGRTKKANTRIALKLSGVKLDALVQ